MQKILFLLLFQATLSFNIQAYTCPDETSAIRAGTIGVIHINEVLASGTVVYSDEMDVELWIAKCVDQFEATYTLMATVVPTVPGSSIHVTHTIVIIQNNEQFENPFSVDQNLFISSDQPQLFTTRIEHDGTIHPLSNVNLIEPFNLIFTCSSIIADITNCSSQNPTVIFNINFSNNIFSNGFELN